MNRKWHHDGMSFGLVCAFSDNFVLPPSHDEMVQGKGSILGLHLLDCESSGFECIDAPDAERSSMSWIRRDDSGHMVIVVCKFTPVPRPGFELGVPVGPQSIRLNLAPPATLMPVPA